MTSRTAPSSLLPGARPMERRGHARHSDGRPPRPYGRIDSPAGETSCPFSGRGCHRAGKAEPRAWRATLVVLWQGVWFAVEWPATSRSGHGGGPVPRTPSRRASYSPPSSERRSRPPPRPVSQLGSCKRPPARLLSRTARAANVWRRHSPSGPTTARGVAWPVIAMRSRPRWRPTTLARIDQAADRCARVSP